MVRQGLLVTGAGRRIGAGIATALAGAASGNGGADGGGYHVFVHHNHSANEADAVVAAIRAAGGSASTVRADLAVEADVEGLIAACEDVAPVTALVNNASLFRYDQVDDTSYAALEENMRVNLYAPVLLARALHRTLKGRDGRGCVINLVDNKVYASNPDYFSYTVSKLGLHGLTETLALAFAPHLRVCAIAPGITLVSGEQSAENFERAHRLTLTGEGNTVAQIAGAVAFILATPAFNGRTLVLDGGQSLLHHPRDVAFL